VNSQKIFSKGGMNQDSGKSKKHKRESGEGSSKKHKSSNDNKPPGLAPKDEIAGRVLKDTIREVMKKTNVPPPNKKWFQIPDTVDHQSGGKPYFTSLSDIHASNDGEYRKFLHPPSFLEVVSNTDKNLIEFIRDNAYHVMHKTLRGTDNYEFLPSQRLAIYFGSNALEFDRTINATMPSEKVFALKGVEPPKSSTAREKERIYVSQTIFKGASPTIQMLSYATGVGKTAISIATAAHVLLDDAKWNYVQDNKAEILKCRYTESNSSIFYGTHPDDLQVARCVFFFIHKNNHCNFLKEVNSMQNEFKRFFGQSVEIWEGIKESKHSLKKIIDTGNKPTFWFLPLGQDGIHVLYNNPLIGYVGSVFDEFTTSITQRHKLTASPNLGPTWICQATIKKLNESMNGNPKHPLAVTFDSTTGIVPITELEDYVVSRSKDKIPTKLVKQFCSLSLTTVPHFLRTAVSFEARSRMPRGIKVYQVNFKMATLTGLLGSDSFSFSSIADYISQQTGGTFKVDPENGFDMSALKSLLEGLSENYSMTTEKRNNVIRLLNNLAEIEQGEPRECCICYSEIDEPLFTACCTATFCRDCFGKNAAKTNSCAHCRQSVTGVIDSSIASTSKNCDVDYNMLKSSETTFDDKIKHINSANNVTFHAAVIHLITAHTAIHPKARMLFYVRFTSFKASADDELVEAINKEFPNSDIINFEKIATNTKLSTEITDQYKDPDKYPTPMILMCNSNKGSKSVSGMDLYTTTLTVYHSSKNGINEDDVEQIRGRACRLGNRENLEANNIVFLKGH
jgi:hypothetical protein